MLSASSEGRVRYDATGTLAKYALTDRYDTISGWIQIYVLLVDRQLQSFVIGHLGQGRQGIIPSSMANDQGETSLHTPNIYSPSILPLASLHSLPALHPPSLDSPFPLPFLPSSLRATGLADAR